MCASASTAENPMVVTLNKNLWTYEGINYCNGSSYNSSDQPQSYQKNYTLIITETSASGKNVEKTGSNGMTENLTIGSEKTGYATAYVKNSETVLSFYPEVPMQAMEYSGDTITSSDSVAIKRVLTIGEEKRNAYSSSLYLFTIKRDKTTSSDDDDLSGTTYSDTAVGGSKASKISDMVTLTAGGDFGVAVKETGSSANLYGYSIPINCQTWRSS